MALISETSGAKLIGDGDGNGDGGGNDGVRYGDCNGVGSTGFLSRNDLRMRAFTVLENEFRFLVLNEFLRPCFLIDFLNCRIFRRNILNKDGICPYTIMLK
jgi:hypothetical protein